MDLEQGVNFCFQGQFLSKTAGGAYPRLREQCLEYLKGSAFAEASDGQHRRVKSGFLGVVPEGWVDPSVCGFSSGNCRGGQVVKACRGVSRGQSQPAGYPLKVRVLTVDRVEKKEMVAQLHDIFSKTSVVVIAQYSGLTVAQMQNLRKQMKQAGAKVQVAKNRLARIALDGTSVASVGALMKGPTLIAWSNDPVAAPKAAVAFAKDFDKFVILGGAMGATALNVDGIKTLATMPSLDELRAKLLGLLVAPATKLAQLATAPAAKLARVVGAYAVKDAA